MLDASATDQARCRRVAAPGTLRPGVAEDGNTNGDGLDRERLEDFFRSSVPGAEPPLAYERIAGGRSNLTYRVSDAGGRAFILRRPPLGTTLGSAHDMGREHRILTGLAGTGVPAPEPIAMCADDSVTGAQFYVMQFVDGLVLRDEDEVEATYRVTTATATRWILRRPPLGTTLGSAHDMGREHRILTGLAGTGVPAPDPGRAVPDESVTGARVLRHGARRRPRAARRGRRRGRVRRAGPPADRGGARRHARRPARRRPRRRRARRARPPRRLRRAPAQALDAPVGGVQDARA